MIQSRCTDDSGEVQPSLAELSKNWGIPLEDWKDPNVPVPFISMPFNPGKSLAMGAFPMLLRLIPLASDDAGSPGGRAGGSQAICPNLGTPLSQAKSERSLVIGPEERNFLPTRNHRGRRGDPPRHECTDRSDLPRVSRPVYGIHLQIVYQPTDREYRSRSSEGFIRVAVQQANLIAGYGIEGDRKAGHHAERQVNLLSREWLLRMQDAGYRISPGQFGEQITLVDIDLDHLKRGERLQLATPPASRSVRRVIPVAGFKCTAATVRAD